MPPKLNVSNVSAGKAGAGSARNNAPSARTNAVPKDPAQKRPKPVSKTAAIPEGEEVTGASQRKAPSLKGKLDTRPPKGFVPPKKAKKKEANDTRLDTEEDFDWSTEGGGCAQLM